jgi:hypothetical protein
VSEFIESFSSFSFLLVLGYELRASHLLGSTLPFEAHLQPFVLWLFIDRVLLFAQASLDCNLPILCFPLQLGWQAQATTSSYFPLSWGVVNFFFFLPLLAWNFDLPNLSLLRSLV